MNVPTIDLNGKTLHAPLVHLNGTGRQSLIDEVRDAVNALHAARDAVATMTVHGRDFYPVGMEHFDAYRSQHRDRLARLEDVQEELEAIWHYLNDAVQVRRPADGDPSGVVSRLRGDFKTIQKL